MFCVPHDQIRHITLDRSVSEVARPVLSATPRPSRDRRRHRRRRADRVRDGVRVRRGRHQGRAGRSGQIGRGSSRIGEPAGSPTIPASSFVEVEKALGLRAAPPRVAGLAPRAASTSRRCSGGWRSSASSSRRVRWSSATTRSRRSVSSASRKRDATPDSMRRCSTPGAVGAEAGLAAPGIRARDGATIDPYRAALGLAARRGRARRADFRAIAGGADQVRPPDRRRPDTPAGRSAPTGSSSPPAGRRRSSKRCGGISGFDTATSRSRRPCRPRSGSGSAGAMRWCATRRSRRTSCGGWETSGCSWPAPTPSHAAGSPARQGDRAAHRSADVRAVDDVSGHLGHRAGVRLGAPYARTPTACRTSVRTGTIPHHLFAFGDSSHSVTGAYLASRILLRHHLDELEPPTRYSASVTAPVRRAGACRMEPCRQASSHLAEVS